MVCGLWFIVYGSDGWCMSHGLNPVSALHVTLKTPFLLADRSFSRAAIGQTRI